METIEYLKHTGLYVEDMDRMVEFYQKTFHMNLVCKNQKDQNPLLDELLGTKGAVICTSKLITERGYRTGVGDMIELVEILEPNILRGKQGKHTYIWENMHIALQVKNITKTIERVESFCGTVMTKVHDMGNGRDCCFCRDPEGNWIELIEIRQ